MKVCILTEGGKKTGFGHIARCISIYQALEEREVKPMLVVNGDETIGDFVKEESYRILDWVTSREELLAILKDSDIVFADSYLAGYDLYEHISKTAETAVYFDDDLRMNYPRGFVVNGAISAERMPYPKRKGVTYLLGLQYAPLRKEFRDAPAKEIFNNLETVMVTFGGADICDLTPKVLKLLVDAYPQLKKKVVAGRSFENTAEIETVKDSNTELVYYPDAAEMKKVMLESDIAISAGGQTLYELARVGVPTIMVAAADNQSANIRGWRKAGFAEYAGDWKDEELPEKICRKIEILKDRNARENRSQHGREIIDGKGGSRIAKEVLSDFCTKHLSLRKATLADAKDLFNLANEDIVRRNSFSQDKIEWVSHQRWLNDRLGDSNCLFLIVTCSGEFTGQVRFDITLPQAVINISLCRNIRGLDLSALVINKSIEELLKARKDVKRIKAYVKNGNIASMKAFENAGFSFLEDTVFKGCETRVYERSFGNE